jgi:hypothetical protein
MDEDGKMEGGCPRMRRWRGREEERKRGREEETKRRRDEGKPKPGWAEVRNVVFSTKRGGQRQHPKKNTRNQTKRNDKKTTSPTHKTCQPPNTSPSLVGILTFLVLYAM